MPRELHHIGRQDHEPIDDARHFYICARCGQPVDKRDPGDCVSHEARGNHNTNSELSSRDSDLIHYQKSL